MTDTNRTSLNPDNPFFDESVQQPASAVPAKDYPGTHADDATVKNPKTPETSGDSRVERVANNAAHKAAKVEQEAEKDRPLFSR